jgi:hypothetical protein
MNCYSTLNEIKSFGHLNITGTSTDSTLLDSLEEGSRQVDRDTDRFFYIYEGTFYQDGGANRLILDWDMQTITALEVDTDGDGVYESTYTVDINSPTTSPDAFAYPAMGYPKTRLEANPYGSYGHFGAGIRKSVKITGTFGYGADWPASNTHTITTKVGAALTSTDATLSATASTASELSAGMTLRINSEQIYINDAPTGSSCPITRAVNGTSAASATASTSIAVYDYPRAISHAVLIFAMRHFKRRESAYANVIGNPLTGEYTAYKRDDPDYLETVIKYRKPRRQWSVNG